MIWLASTPAPGDGPPVGALGCMFMIRCCTSFRTAEAGMGGIYFPLAI